MASRRNQLHSYQFMVQRVVAALVMRETDPAQSPFRRAAGAIFAGIMIGAIVLAGFAVYGLWDPGGNMRWKADSDANNGQPVVVIEEETGARYVYMQGVLYPVENYASALLVGTVDGRTKEPYYVSRDSLADAEGIQLGPRIGIPGAPDSLPSQENLIRGDWSLCTQPRETSSGETELETVLVVGAQPSPKEVMANEGVLLVQEAESSAKYLIYHSHKFRISQEAAVLEALSIRDRTPLQVGAAWLNGLPEGQEIKPLEVPDKGEPSELREDLTIGTLIYVETEAGGNYYVAMRDKLAAITEFQAAILRAAEDVEPVSMTLGEASAKETTDQLLPSRQQLEAPPETATLAMADPNPQQATCAVFGANGDRPPTIVYNGDLSAYEGGVLTVEQGDEGVELAGRVVVAPGKGTVVWTSQNPEDRTGGLLVLITDTGYYYPLESVEILERLGYDLKATNPGWVPTSLVERLPRGPTLSPEAAMKPVPMQ